MRERGRFTPARDPAGRPTADRHRAHVHWDMPPQMPIATASVAPPPIVTSSIKPPPAGPAGTPRVSATRGAISAAVQASATPRTPLQSLVQREDYPASALAAREQGRPRFRLTIGVDGRVTGCVILVSSGSSALDLTSCRLMRNRARFTPARDSAGNPVEDQYFGELAWRIED